MQENIGTRTAIEKQKRRLPEIDVLKGLGIMLMVAGHMHFSEAIFNKYVYAFHMPLFFLVSGYLYRYPTDVKEAILHKSKTLLVPYFSFAVIYEAFWILCGRESKEAVWNFGVSLLFRGTDGIPVESALWFLLSSFFVYIVFIFIERRVISVWWKTIVVTGLTIAGCIGTPVLFDGYIGGGYCTALSALTFFYIGTLVRKYWYIVKKYFDISKKRGLYVGVVLVNGILILINGKVNMRTGEWAFIPLSYINAVIGVWIYACLSVIIVDKTEHFSKILQYIGKNAIVFVCTNHLAIRVSEKAVRIIADRKTVGVEVFIFLLTIILICITAEVFNKTKLRCLIGR